MIGVAEPATPLEVASAAVALLAVVVGAVARSVPPLWQSSLGLCTALAGLFILVCCLWTRRRLRPWAAAAVRLGASALLEVFSPDSLPAMSLLPSTAFTLASVRVSRF
jgi:protein-S-isoprenylcysteine O-methyltransferase Ste14